MSTGNIESTGTTETIDKFLSKGWTVTVKNLKKPKGTNKKHGDVIS